MKRMVPILTAMLLLLSMVVVACEITSTQEDNFTVTYEPAFNTVGMQRLVDNTYFPLLPGSEWEYTAETEDGSERVLVQVLQDNKTVSGIPVTVVRDRVYLEGELIEDTYDWYAQDAAGNVWYMGEDTKEYEGGQVVSTAGSWEAGVDGARAGVIMPATPAAGQAYYQEFYAGEAEDRAQVLAVNQSVTVPTGTYTGCLQTEDTTPLERDVLEHKYYCPGVGLVLTVNKEANTREELKRAVLPE